MGIYDREYYRDDSRGAGWFSGVAPACKTIIAVNVGVYILQVLAGNSSEFFAALTAHSSDIFRHGRVWQLLTATFLHDPNAPFHLIWNMLFLWVVGREMEAMYGSREFTALYLASAIFSTLCWAIVDGLTPIGGGYMLGASGAVISIVVLYTLYNPRRELLLFFVLPVEAWILLVVFLGRDAFMLFQQFRRPFSPDSEDSVAVAAHLGGALFGFLYKTYDLRISSLFDRKNRRPRFRVISPEPTPRERDRPSPLPMSTTRSASASTPRAVSPAVFPEEQLDARLDEVLAKIAREGRDRLTDEDNHILQEASRRARDRRSDRV